MISSIQRKRIEDYYENYTDDERLENIDTYRRMFNFKTLQSSSAIDSSIKEYINTERHVDDICMDYKINARTFYRNLQFVKDVITIIEGKKNG